MFLLPLREDDHDNKNRVLGVCMVCLKKYTVLIEDYSKEKGPAYCPACQFDNAVILYPIMLGD